jgi:iron complex outermembrane receptor protein
MNLSKAAGTALGGTPAAVVGSSPRHQVEIRSSFDISKQLQFDFAYRYVSALPAQSAPAYSTADAQLAWRFHPHLELSVSGRNLFQPHHVEYAADPDGPVGIIRSVYASISWRM